MGSPYQSEEVCCFNAGNWNLVRCACYMICTLQERKKQNKKQALHSSSRLCFPPSTADLIHGIKTELSEFCMNKSFTSVSLHVTLFLFFFLCVVHLCRSLRRGRCCKLRKKAADLLPPASKLRWAAWVWRWIYPYSVCKPRLFQLRYAHEVFIL